MAWLKVKEWKQILKGKTEKNNLAILLSYKYTLRKNRIINPKEDKYVMIKFEFSRKINIVTLMHVIA